MSGANCVSVRLQLIPAHSSVATNDSGPIGGMLPRSRPNRRLIRATSGMILFPVLIGWRLPFFGDRFDKTNIGSTAGFGQGLIVESATNEPRGSIQFRIFKTGTRKINAVEFSISNLGSMNSCTGKVDTMKQASFDECTVNNECIS